MNETGTAVNVEEATLAYLSTLPAEVRKEQQVPLNRFVRWMGRERALGEIRPPEVSGFAEGSLGTGVMDVARLLQPVKDFLTYAKKKGLTSTNLSVHIKFGRMPVKGPVRRPAVEARSAITLTADGLRKMQEELESLKAERPRLAEAIRLARADGDISENAPYHAAKEHQGHVEARIRELEATLNVATVMGEPAGDGVKVDLGARVILEEEGSGREFTYLLVNPNEARPAEGRLSVASPLGRSLVNRAQDEV
ncbi:MAG: transcription elongation factor GreA, partial [SAR202 cluster bacterium]|nr:transcription elongation factor GreA [SAR202 cluster bacterium]